MRHHPGQPGAHVTGALELHDAAVVVDCHNDLIETLTHPELGDRGTLRGRWIPDLRQGGIDVQVVPVYAEGKAEGTLRLTLDSIAALYRELESNAEDVELCLDGADVRRAVGAGRIGFVLALEGGSAIGSNPELVLLLHKLGVRMISFAHFGRTYLADGSGEDATMGRLTRAGVATFKEMERLGLLFDVSHLAIAGVDHVLELATRPVVASHSMARAINDHHRNLSDAHIRAIGQGGGVVCANAVPGFIDPGNPNVERMVDHIEHIADVAGAEHVGIGTDFCVELFEELYSPHQKLVLEGIDARQKLEGLWKAPQMPLLTEVMLRRGMTEAQVRAILGGNLLRLFDAELGRPADS